MLMLIAVYCSPPIPESFVSAFFLHPESFLQIVSNYPISSVIHIIKANQLAFCPSSPRAQEMFTTHQHQFTTMIVVVKWSSLITNSPKSERTIEQGEYLLLKQYIKRDYKGEMKEQ